MEVKYASIKIRNSSTEKINRALALLELHNVLRLDSQVSIEIGDLTSDFLIMSQFLAENELKDETAFYNDFDIDSYGLYIDFNFNPLFKNIEVIQAAIFVIAGKLSGILRSDCLVMFENGTVPVGLFENRSLVNCFAKYNAEFFSNKLWRPNL